MEANQAKHIEEINQIHANTAEQQQRHDEELQRFTAKAKDQDEANASLQR